MPDVGQNIVVQGLSLCWPTVCVGELIYHEQYCTTKLHSFSLSKTNAKHESTLMKGCLSLSFYEPLAIA